MSNGKIRHKNHLIDARAQQFINNIFPTEWVQRTMTPDYGIDIDLELFENENGQFITLGEHIYLQIKGTEHAEYSTINPYGNDIYSKDENKTISIPVIKFVIETSELGLVERMGSAVPVMLVVIDLENSKAYYVCLNDYIRYVLPFQNSKFRQQQNITIYIPTENIVSKDNINPFQWYGKRTKLYALFQDFHTLYDNVIYLNSEELINETKFFIEYTLNADAWNFKNQWPLLADIYNTMIKMYKNDMIEECGYRLFVSFENKDDASDPYNVLVIYNGIEMPLRIAAKAESCNIFIKRAISACSIFENDLRHIGLPTQFSHLMYK